MISFARIDYRRWQETEYKLQFQTFILMYSTKIFCFVETIYILLNYGNPLFAYPFNEVNYFSRVYDIILNIRVVFVSFYPNKIAKDNDWSALWILVIASLAVIIVSILGLLGILRKKPSLMIPYLIYRWVWLFTVIFVTWPFIISVNLMARTMRLFSYIPTFYGYWLITIPLISSSGDFLAVFLRLILIVLEIYSTATVVCCYENIKASKRIVRSFAIIDEANKLTLSQEPVISYQAI